MSRFLILIAAAFWSLSGAFAKILALPGPSMAAYRALTGGLFLLIFVRPQMVRWSTALLGLALCYTLMNVCYLSAMTLTTAANSIFLQSTAPVWMLLFSVFCLGETLDRRSLFCVLVGLGGMACIAGGGWQQSPTGITLALLSGVFYGGVTVLLRYLRNDNPLWLVCICNLGTSLLLFPVLFLPGQVSPMELTGNAMILLLIFGTVQMALPYLCYARSLQHLSPQEAGVLTLLEPVLNPFITYFAVGEKPAATTVIGGAVVLFAVALRYAPTRFTKRSTPKRV